MGKLKKRLVKAGDKILIAEAKAKDAWKNYQAKKTAQAKINYDNRMTYLDKEISKQEKTNKLKAKELKLSKLKNKYKPKDTGLGGLDIGGDMFGPPKKKKGRNNNLFDIGF